jgi:hypothetical protein
MFTGSNPPQPIVPEAELPGPCIYAHGGLPNAAQLSCNVQFVANVTPSASNNVPPHDFAAAARTHAQVAGAVTCTGANSKSCSFTTTGNNPLRSLPIVNLWNP